MATVSSYARYNEPIVNLRDSTRAMNIVVPFSTTLWSSG